MLPHRFSTILLATGLMLSALGCSKKDDPGAKPISNIGSYLCDGQLVSCTATADPYTSMGTDYLTIDLTTTPQPTIGKEMLRLIYAKNTSEPVSAYELLQMQQFNSGAITALYNADAFTITPTSTGGYSGTFSSVSRYSIPGVTLHNFTSGVFTDVHP